MARVTIEDCLVAVGGHFDVVNIAAARAHKIELGKAALLERGSDKSTVLSLREVAAGLVGKEILDESSDDLVDAQETGLSSQVSDEDVGQMVADTDQYSDIQEHDQPNATDLSADDATTESEQDQKQQEQEQPTHTVE